MERIDMPYEWVAFLAIVTNGLAMCSADFE